MTYTVQDLFDITLGLMNDQKANSSSYSEFILPVTNTILSECLVQENNLRLLNKQEVLTEAPVMVNFSDVIPYHDELVRNVLPYGVGMFLFLGDDENVKATFFSTKYDENKSKYSPAVYVEVEAMY